MRGGAMVARSCPSRGVTGRAELVEAEVKLWAVGDEWGAWWYMCGAKKGGAALRARELKPRRGEDSEKPP